MSRVYSNGLCNGLCHGSLSRVYSNGLCNGLCHYFCHGSLSQVFLMDCVTIFVTGLFNGLCHYFCHGSLSRGLQRRTSPNDVLQKRGSCVASLSPPTQGPVPIPYTGHLTRTMYTDLRSFLKPLHK